MREGAPQWLGAEEDERDFNSADEHDDDRLLDHTELATHAARAAAFEEAMKRRGFALRRMAPDGNCLFRAVSESVYGDAEMHAYVRQLCVEHMRKECAHFSRYVTQDFSSYLERKARLGVHGNNVEMAALSEMYCRPLLVYQHSTEPINTFQPQEGGAGGQPPIHLSYEGGRHYNALIDLDEPAVGVGLGLAGYEPQAQRQAELKSATAASEREALDSELLGAAAASSEQHEIEAQIERAVAEVRPRSRGRTRHAFPSARAACALVRYAHPHMVGTEPAARCVPTRLAGVVASA